LREGACIAKGYTFDGISIIRVIKNKIKNIAFSG